MGLKSKARFAAKLLTARFSSRRKPLVVHMNVTNYCNLHCSYCYWGTENATKTKDFTTNQVIELIEELADMGTLRLNFGAGEPLIRKDIGQLIDHAHSRGILTNLNTNGHLVPEKIHELRNLTTLCISIDGDEKTHDADKGKGSFRKVVEAIKIAKQEGLEVHTSTVITKNNVHSLDKIFELSREYDFQTQWLLPFFQGKGEFLADNVDCVEAVNKIIDYKKKGYPVITSMKSLNYALEWQDYRKRAIKHRLPKNAIPCYAGRFMCIINSDGKVYPCSQMIDTDFQALDFRKVGFKKAWNNLQENPCKTCYAFMAFNDYNLIISHNIPTIWNYIKKSI